MALDELLFEEKKIKKNQMYAALGSGFLIGIMVFGYLKKGFGLIYIFIPILYIIGISSYSKAQKQNLEQIRTEINNRSKY